MYIGLTPELTELRDELRDYYAKLLTPEVEAQLSTGEGIGPVPRKIWKQMAADGWAGIGWPTEYGGQGRTAIEQFIFFDESMRVGAPVPMLTINSVAPTIMRYGSQEQKDFYLPKILKGEIHFAIGYTEPDAGTDLASLKTRADRDGDEYVINGQKVFTSLASDSDYIWLAVRTDQNVKKHKGISIIIVPTDTPGFKFEPIKNM
ncbi:MAG: acyl-CoA dehydrogenase family protein, partial [Acidimicrobiia bacterium]